MKYFYLSNFVMVSFGIGQLLILLGLITVSVKINWNLYSYIKSNRSSEVLTFILQKLGRVYVVMACSGLLFWVILLMINFKPLAVYMHDLLSIIRRTPSSVLLVWIFRFLGTQIYFASWSYIKKIKYHTLIHLWKVK